ncbi:bile acid:sodium symporter family protein [Natronococcus wangiae]|uniref:bile acid:sodium symporter family protein n=1 Tax=Natronococcus wangiae TaxID=3068275 RepID=UPI00274027B0|nr:bile acid:sodium symporter [Natronococcus sp. AD5]
MLTATLAGVAYPEFAAPLQPLLPVLVAGLIFTAFYGLNFGDVSARSVSVPLIVSLVCLYLIVPIALYPVAALVLSGEILLGVLVVLSAPLAAGSSIIWTRLSGGNTLLATVIVLVSMLLAPLVMPAIITLFADSAVEISVSELFVELAAIILAAGVLAFLVPNGAVSDGQLDGFSVATMGALIYAGVGGSPVSFDAFQFAFVGGIAVAALCLSAAVSYVLHVRGMRSDDCLTVLFSSSMKNMSVSVMVGAVFGGGAIIASITAFHVAQQVVSSSLVRRLESATPAQSSETVTAGLLGD